MNSDKVNLKFIKALSNDMKIEIINQQNEIKNTRTHHTKYCKTLIVNYIRNFNKFLLWYIQTYLVISQWKIEMLFPLGLSWLGEFPHPSGWGILFLFHL